MDDPARFSGGPAAELPIPPGERLASQRGARVLLALALLLALVRLVRLSSFGLWLDEALTWADRFHGLDGGQIANPLGYLLIGWWVERSGGEPSEAALRLLPALAGVLCVPLTAFALRPWIGLRRAAFAALLLAVSPWHLFWSQTARFYTFAQALVLLGAGIHARRIARGDPYLATLGLVVAAAGGLFHPTAAFALPGLALAPQAASLARDPLPPRARRAARVVLATLVLAGLLLLPYARRWLEHHHRQKPLADPLHFVLTLGHFVGPLLLAAAALGVVLAVLRRDRGGVLAATVAAVGIAIPLAISLFAQMTAQYAFVVLPWIAGAAACLLPARAQACAPLAPPVWALGALFVLPGLAEQGLELTSRQGGRARWREAYEYVAEHRERGDLVLGHAAQLGELYLGRGNTDLRKPLVVSPLERWFPHAPRHWTRHPRRIWIVYRPQWLADMEPVDQRRLERFLAEECTLRARFPVPLEGRDLEVLVYRRG